MSVFEKMAEGKLILNATDEYRQEIYDLFKDYYEVDWLEDFKDIDTVNLIHGRLGNAMSLFNIVFDDHQSFILQRPGFTGSYYFEFNSGSLFYCKNMVPAYAIILALYAYVKYINELKGVYERNR